MDPRVALCGGEARSGSPGHVQLREGGGVQEQPGCMRACVACRGEVQGGLIDQAMRWGRQEEERPLGG